MIFFIIFLFFIYLFYTSLDLTLSKKQENRYFPKTSSVGRILPSSFLSPRKLTPIIRLEARLEWE